MSLTTYGERVMSESPLQQQAELCRRLGIRCEPPEPGTKVGISVNLRAGAQPINGLRHKPEAGTNGWFLWRGEELESRPDYFAPVHVEHLPTWSPRVLPYLGLPPGWRFLIDDEGYEDVWFDPSLVDGGA